MTMKEAFLWGEKSLVKGKIEEARYDAWYLLEYVTKVSRALYFAMPERPLTRTQEEQYGGLIKKRAGHIPLQHLTGEQEFMGLTFKVNENVLIPRQDTETVVQEALSLLEKCTGISGTVKILDLCTGCGCILLSLLHYAAKRGIPVKGTGTDISRKALETAALNAKGLKTEAEFLQSDLFEKIDGKWSMIVSNPPYIKTGDLSTLAEEVRLHEPLIALDGKEDGLYFYREIIGRAGKYLEGEGFLVLEIGFDQGKSVKELMEKAGCKDIRIKKDLAGLDRVAACVYDNNKCF